jgi:hypothetical protein
MMETTKTKSGCLRRTVLTVLVAVLIIGGPFLGWHLFWDLAHTRHKAVADKGRLGCVYSALSKYRETHGRWPETINEAAKEFDMMPVAAGEDSIFHRPWLYYPNAKPGTKDVLVAVPDVIRMKSLPFVGWQDAVLADGTFVDFRSSAAAGSQEHDSREEPQ